MLLFLNHSIDFPAFYETSVCLSCTASNLFLSRNSCYSSTVHTVLMLYICPQAQVCEHRYSLCVTHCQHTATSKCWNCFSEVLDILGCWLSLVFFKALQHFCKENDKELHRLQRKFKQKWQEQTSDLGFPNVVVSFSQLMVTGHFSRCRYPNTRTSSQDQGASKF